MVRWGCRSRDQCTAAKKKKKIQQLIISEQSLGVLREIDRLEISPLRMFNRRFCRGRDCDSTDTRHKNPSLRRVQSTPHPSSKAYSNDALRLVDSL
jgi:hypothetical protein